MTSMTKEEVVREAAFEIASLAFAQVASREAHAAEFGADDDE